MFSFKNLLFIFLLFLIAGWYCSGTSGSGKANSKSVTSPSNDSTYLVCGSIIVENNWREWSEIERVGAQINEHTKTSQQVQEVYKADIEVDIVGKVFDKNGKEKVLTFNAATDENGYFFIENVPPGKYALRGFYVEGRSGAIRVASSLGGVGDSYYKVRDYNPYFFKGTYFPHKPNNRILNLRHNVFFLSNTPMLGHQTFVEIRNQSFNFKDIKYTMPPIEQYLIDKYPDNEWKKYLLASKQKNIKSVR